VLRLDFNFDIAGIVEEKEGVDKDIEIEEIRPNTLQIGLFELSSNIFPSCSRLIFLPVPCW
jgi:hypothetical protein